MDFHTSHEINFGRERERERGGDGEGGERERESARAQHAERTQQTGYITSNKCRLYNTVPLCNPSFLLLMQNASVQP